MSAPGTQSAPTPSPQLGGKLLDLLAGVLELAERGRGGDAEVRAGAEGRTVHHRDARLLEKLGDEVLVRSDHMARRRRLTDRFGDRRIDVERALRLRACDVLRLVQHRDDK